MRQEYVLIGLGVPFAIIGGALLLVPDLGGAGWYALGCGLVCVAAGAWFLRRGGNVPHPPADPPRLPSPAPGRGCPKCGAASRPMTGAETTDFYGYDRFVLVRPRVCLACGHGFEAQPSRAGCYLMVGVAAVGALIGVGFIALGPLMLRDALLDATATAVERFKLALGGVGACGVGAVWVWRCWKTAHRYWLLKDKA